MPQLLVLAAIGAGLYAGARIVHRIAAGVAAEVEKAQQSAQAEPVAVPTKDLGRLEYDATTGVYRPVASQ
jgi:hypothetical protein